MVQERREHVRHKVFGGNAEIQAVIGRGRKPDSRARIVDWSRSGMRLKVASPRRRFLIQRMDPVLFEDDSVVCTLRLPPMYQDIFVNAEVVRVERAGDDPDALEVGLRFDLASTPDDKLEALAKLLEPRPRSTSGRLLRVSGEAARISQKLSRPSSSSGRSRSSTSGRVSGRSKRASSSSARTSRRSRRLPPQG